MSKYTKKQRHEIYKKALPIIKTEHYVCIALDRALGECIVSDEYCQEHLEEIWLCRNEEKAQDIIGNFLSIVGCDNMEEKTNQRELMVMFCIEMTR